MTKLIIFLLIGILWTSDAVIPDPLPLIPDPLTCDPDTDCLTRDIGAKVPDTNDCEKYYFCVDSGSAEGTPVASTISLSCPVGTHFNFVQESCETGVGACINECRKEGICDAACPVPIVGTSVVANKYDCSQYSSCSDIFGIVNATCADSTPYFNGVKCVDNLFQCCDFCTPYCVKIGLEIQDPCDCTSFYVCRNIGKPSDNTRGTCPSGFYYDEANHSCINGSCSSLCSGEGCVKVPSTISTTTVTTTPTTSSSLP